MSDSPVGLRPERAVPSTLDLVRLSRRPLFSPGGRDLNHRIALLADVREGQELLVAPSGFGTTLEYFVRELGVQGSGVDEDPALVEQAEARAKASGVHERIQFQSGSMGELPYRDGVFEVVIGELGLTARVDPPAAVAELARVLGPGGRLALVQLVWKAPVERERREEIARHLGVRPLMLVELKRILLDAGIEGLHTEEWSGEGGGLRPRAGKPFPDFAELFTLREKLGIVRRAMARWGWRGVRTTLARERAVHHLLTRERILGLTLILGRKATREPEPPRSLERDRREDRGGRHGQGHGQGPGRDQRQDHAETGDLPLFVQGERG
jgi:SAM-dependent methyltransferase